MILLLHDITREDKNEVLTRFSQTNTMISNRADMILAAERQDETHAEAAVWKNITDYLQAIAGKFMQQFINGIIKQYTHIIFILPPSVFISPLLVRICVHVCV